DQAGRAVAGIGDVNGDGLDDVAVGAPFADAAARHRPGAVYVVFGRPGGASVDLASLGPGGYVIEGAHEQVNLPTEVIPGSQAGAAVAAAGDVNRDGRPDVLVGAPTADNALFDRPQTGGAYVVWGKATTTPVDLRAMQYGSSSTAGVSVFGAYGSDDAGRAVTGIADRNGDGRPEIVVGSPRVGGPFPLVHLVHGFTSGERYLGNWHAADGIRMNGVASHRPGSALDGAGDTDRDGREDLLVGAPEAYVDGRGAVGTAHLVRLGAGTQLHLDGLGDRGLRVLGAAAGDRVGHAVAGVGDVDGDGAPDAAVGAPGRGGDRGAVYVLFGDRPRTQPSCDTVCLPARVRVSAGRRVRGVLVGTRGGDRLVGGAKDDRVEGRTGDDLLLGGDGGDKLLGGAGGDRLAGGPGRDVYAAGPGDDVVQAADGVGETIDCGPGRDVAVIDPLDTTTGCEHRRIV
ncbi:MAG: integrin alpha, partial [Actinomycetota bacterium]